MKPRIGVDLASTLFLAVMLMTSNAMAQPTSFVGTWTPRPLAQTAASAPYARGWVDLIFDPVVGRPVLFGGSGSFYMNDILEIDFAGSRWVEIQPRQPTVTPVGPPSPRDEHAVEYDPYNQLYWTFGGSGFDSGGHGGTIGPGSTSSTIVDPSLSESNAEYYKDWSVTIVANNAFYTFVSAYDPSTKTLTLQTAFPGSPTGLTYYLRPQTGGGTWYYNPATEVWKGFDAPSYGYVGAKPASRLSPAFAYSARDHAIVMFGGMTHNDTWALDVESRTWAPLQADGTAGLPPRRAQITNSMVYDPVNDVFVLFGGQCSEASCGSVPSNGLLGDTWLYHLPTNQWTLMTPTVSPPASQQHTLSYDSEKGVVILFGGLTANGRSNDIWAYDVPSNTWSHVSVAGQIPEPRRVHAMVFDPVLGEHVVYGGTTSGDVWSLRLTQTTSNAPPLASLVINPASGNLLTIFQCDGSASRDPDGSIVSYAWDFGDGNTAVGATASHQYAAAGTYTIRLTVTDNLGATGSNDSTVNIGSGAIPTTTTLTSSLNPSTPGSSVTFTATVNGSSPTGTVAFSDNGTAIADCASVTLAGTAAQCATSILTTGSHNIIAVYGGDAANAASTSQTLTQVVSATSRINVALAANGSVASASSTYTAGGYDFSPAAANDGHRTYVGWGTGGAWVDGTSGVFPDWLQINFSGAKTIDRVDVFSVQNAYAAPVEPTSTTTFSLYGLSAFDVQSWNGSAWVTVPGGSISSNNLVWRTITFPPVTTDRIRVLVTGAPNYYSRIVELEAWSAGNVPANTPPTVSLTAPSNNTSYVAPASITFTASAADSDGSVTQVEFLHGDTVIGTATGPAFTLTWTNVPAGNYTLTARATDNASATTTSTPVNVAVTATPPQIAISGATLVGSVSDAAILQITVNGTSVPVVNGQFQAPISLPGGTSTHTIGATNAGGTTTRTITITVP